MARGSCSHGDGMNFLWRSSTEKLTYTVAYLECSDELTKANLCWCRCSPGPLPLPACNVIVCLKPRTLPDYFSAGGAFVISEKLRRILESFDVPAEYIHVEVIPHGRKGSNKTYYLLNPLEAIDCFDYEKSEYESQPAGVTHVSKFFIDDAKTVGRHLFRVGPIGWEDSPNPKAVVDSFVCVSEELALAARSAGVTGVVFSPLVTLSVQGIDELHSLLAFPRGAIASQCADESITQYEISEGFVLPQGYIDFCKRLGAGELGEKYHIASPGYPDRHRCGDLRAFNLKVHGPPALDESSEYCADPTRYQRLVFFCEDTAANVFGFDPTEISCVEPREYNIWRVSRIWDLELVGVSFVDFINNECLSREHPPTLTFEPLRPSRKV